MMNNYFNAIRLYATAKYALQDYPLLETLDAYVNECHEAAIQEIVTVSGLDRWNAICAISDAFEEVAPLSYEDCKALEYWLEANRYYAF